MKIYSVSRSLSALTKAGAAETGELHLAGKVNFILIAFFLQDFDYDFPVFAIQHNKTFPKIQDSHITMKRLKQKAPWTTSLLCMY